MSGLGLRYCQQHPGAPLLLVVRGRSAWWACEINQCAYTEDVIRDGRTALAVNGQQIKRPTRRSPKSNVKGRR